MIGNKTAIEYLENEIITHTCPRCANRSEKARMLHGLELNIDTYLVLKAIDELKNIIKHYPINIKGDIT